MSSGYHICLAQYLGHKRRDYEGNRGNVYIFGGPIGNIAGVWHGGNMM